MLRDSRNIIPVSMAVLLHVVIFGSMIMAYDYARPKPFTPLAVQATLVTEVPETTRLPVVEPEPEPVPESISWTDVLGPVRRCTSDSCR